MSDPTDQTETLSGDQPAPDLSGSQPSRMLGGRYLLEERVASGGMASVWRAHDEKLARTVAVKLLHDHLSADDAFRERFRREAVSAAKLSHPNIVGVYDTGTDDDRAYLVMEFVEGITLKDVMADLGRLEAGQAAAIGEKVARALDYAHSRGLVHRDVKPANVLIGDGGLVKIADFGIAKAEEAASDLTKTGMVLGTAAYVAPEQILAKELDGRADQYGLACVLYEALTGRQPFKGDSPVATAAQRLETDPLPVRSIRADVPRALDDVIMRGLAREPEGRYATTGAMADELALWADANADQTVALTTANVDAPGPTGAGTAVDDADDDRPAVPHESFVRTEGRWLAPVVTLIVLAVGLAVIGIATGILEGDRTPSLLARDGGGGGAADAERSQEQDVVVEPAGLQAFDPEGDGGENDDALASITDGDPETFWRAELYNSEDFGGLKDGVGFVVDLGAPHRLSQVELRTPLPGQSYELRVADEPVDSIDGWQRVASVTDDDAEVAKVGFSEDVTTRYLLVWLVAPLQPAPDDSRFTGAFSDMTIRGTPQ